MAEMANNPQYPGVQPPRVGSVDPRSFAPQMPFQFQPGVPAPQSQQFIPGAPQQFQPVGHVSVMNSGLPSQAQQPQFPLMQQFPARPGPPALNPLPPPPNPVPLANVQANMHMTHGPQANVQALNNYPPNVGGTGAPPPASYRFAPPSYGQPHMSVSVNSGTQFQPISQMHVPNIPVGGQSGLSVSQSSISITPLEHKSEESPAMITTVTVASVQSKPAEGASVDWIEHTSADGRKYYYNRRTRQSSWDKPYELMTLIERADASTDWKEFMSPDGRKYYHNKVTKQSKWTLPEELKLARELVEKASSKGTQSEASATSQASASVPSDVVKASTVDTAAFTIQGVARSPLAAEPVSTGNVQPATAPESLASPVPSPLAEVNMDGIQTITDTNTPVTAVSETTGTAVIDNTVTEPTNSSRNLPAQGTVSSADEVPKQMTNEDMMAGEKTSEAVEEKAVEREHLTYASKLEAKNAFKALLESANVGFDWTWDQTMRAIINDKRYGALRTLGERKQAFNEFLVQKKKQDAEERRAKLKKAREDFKKMLEESTELTSSTRWSKALTLFENDERFIALEREKERRDLFDDHLDELKQKEKAKAIEDRKRNLIECRQFLQSCDFIKANTQWRKVKDRLEVDERYSRLDKIEQLELFQEYIRDLEKEEEEKRKIQKEELRKAERKNRDEFRKLMQGHVSEGTLTAKTNWRDYHMKVKDLPVYVAAASNTSGAIPKELFEDVIEELEKQYQEDKARVKDTVKFKKIPVSSTTKLEDLKASIAKDADPAVSDVNLKMIFDELLERARDKEEKEAKKRKRLADDFLDLLRSSKEISSSSTWEDCQQLFEGRREFSSIEESSGRKIFDEYLGQLKELANDRKRREDKAKKEKEREGRERKKARHGRDKERGREREKDRSKKDRADSEHVDVTDDYENEHRSGKDNDKKHRKRRKSSHDDLNGDEKDRSRSYRRHSDHHKKSRRHASTPESESESKHKKHKKDHHNGSPKSGDELEDGEFGAEAESR